jgi:outer membrane protein TolC
VGTTVLTATPTAVGTPVATVLPATVPIVAAAPTTVATTATTLNQANRIVDANNPAVAAAIAAYHVVDGFFDSSKPRIEARSTSLTGRSTVRSTTPTKPTKLDTLS